MADKPAIIPKKLSDSFEIGDNSFNKIVQDKNTDRIQIELGDSKQPDFKPQYKFMRWDNEVNFSIRAEEDSKATVEVDEAGKVQYKDAKKSVNMYEVPTDDGGFTFETELLEKPETNTLSFTINSKELNFFYQPALTQEEIDQGAGRPDNVVGSYAVYHKSKRDNIVGGKHYKTGKAFHLYRAKAIDATGEWVWCDYNDDLQTTGVLITTIPQKFLDEATYPVKVR